MKTIITILSICLLSGCISTTPDVQVIRQWEGHYYTVEEFQQATTNIVLEKKESIWVLSNETLKRLLQNTRKN